MREVLSNLEGEGLVVTRPGRSAGAETSDIHCHEPVSHLPEPLDRRPQLLIGASETLRLPAHPHA